jgi:hypothetical protein
MGGLGEEKTMSAFTELDGEGAKDGESSLITLRGHDGHLLKVDTGSADFSGAAVVIEEGVGERSEGLRRGGFETDTTGFEKGDRSFADTDRNEGLNHTGNTFAGDDFLDEFLIFLSAQAERQSSQSVEGMLITLEEITLGESFDEAMLASVFGCFGLHGRVWFG